MMSGWLAPLGLGLLLITVSFFGEAAKVVRELEDEKVVAPLT